MFSDFPLFPHQASTGASQVDALFLWLVGLSAVMSILIAGILILFAIKYRRGSKADRTDAPTGSLKLELLWSIIPFFIVMFTFVWSTSVYFQLSRPPDDTMDILVVGKRWMWKLQHLNGRREINELHVPVGRAVRLTMTSEDVIHSFYVPAFRTKMDVLPGRYTTTWFKPTRPGTYHLFCAEYCGTRHSHMIGSVVVMEPDKFQAWLGGDMTGVAPAAAGERLFSNLGCVSCHNPDSKGRGPSLAGVYGKRVTLTGGATTIADDAYIRESIVDPRAKMVTGYEPLMPTFRGLVGEEGLYHLLEYIKTLSPPEAGAAPATPGGVEKESGRS